MRRICVAAFLLSLAGVAHAGEAVRYGHLNAASDDPHTVAIEDEPLDSVISDTRRMV